MDPFNINNQDMFLTQPINQEEERKRQATAATPTGVPAKPPVPNLENLSLNLPQTKPMQLPSPPVAEPTPSPVKSDLVPLQETTQREKGIEVSEPVRKAQEASFKAQEDSYKKIAEAEKAIASAEADKYEKVAAAKLSEAQRVKDQQDQYKQNLATEMGKYESAYKQLEEANKTTINPRAYIDRMSTGSKVMVGIGLLLSGFGGADSVTKSMSIINKAIDDDIEAQKITREGKIEAAKTGIARIDKTIVNVRENLKDDNAFNLLQRDLRLGAVEDTLSANIAKSKNEAATAKMQLGIAQVQQLRADNMMKLEQLAADKVKTETISKKPESVQATKAKALEASLTPAQKKADEEYGKEYTLYAAAGGKVGLDNKIKKLETAKERLQSTEMPSRFVGMLPETAQKAIAPEFAQIGDDIKGAVQETLRQVLGAQFTEKEGATLMNRAFDPALSKEENLRRLDNVISDLKSQAVSKKQAADYYEKMGTLQGFKVQATVKIQAPDGSIAEVPQSKADYYLKKGGKLVE